MIFPLCSGERLSVTLAQYMLNAAMMTSFDEATGAHGPETPFLGLEVQLADGEVRRIEAAAGFNAMELMRAAGVPIKAECGGSGVCAT